MERPEPCYAGGHKLLVELSKLFFENKAQKIPITKLWRVSLRFLALVVLLSCHSISGLAQSPGGVSGNLRLWLKANTGVTGVTPITNWTDQSGNGVTLTVTGDPTLVSNSINFNQAIKFDPAVTADWLETNLSINSNTYGDLTIYAIYSPRIAASNGVWGEDDGAWDRFLIDNDRAATLINAIGNGTASETNIPNMFPTGSPVVTTVVFEDGVTNGTFAYAMGKQEANFTSNNGTESSSNFFIGTIGSNTSTLDAFDGDIAEIIVVSALPSSTEREQIESYLALKYGLTLDQSTAQSYLASNGTTKIWDKDQSGASVYNNDIAGIGKDNTSDLDQPKSKSVNSDAVVTVENASSLDDMDFLTWGNNDAALTEGTGEISGLITKRLAREWLVNGAGDVGSLDLSIDVSQSSLSGKVLSDFALIIDSDGDFSNGFTSIVSASSFSSDIVQFTGVTLAAGNYFTLATEVETISPGAVSTNLNLWLKADAGTSTTTDGAALTSWSDQSSGGHSASDNGGIGTVTFENGSTDLVNFNPVIKMVGADKTMSFTPFSLRDVIIVSRVDGATPEWGGILGTGDFGIRTGHTSGVNARWLQGSFEIGNVGIEVNGITTNDHNREVHVSFHNSNTSRTVQHVGGYFSINTSRFFTGEIMEVIGYSSDLSANSVDRIQSYLALKYGVTLDQTSGLDYLASNGIVIWDYSENTTYKHDIAGIAKDLTTALDQSKSKSENSDAILTVESAASIPDGHHLIWGNNDGATTAASVVTVSSEAHERMGRIWRIQEKNMTDAGSGIGTVDELGQVNLSFDLTGISHTAADVRLLVSSNDSFSTHTSHTGSFNGDVVTFNNIDIDDAEFLTLTLRKASKLSFTLAGGVQPSETQVGQTISPTVKVSIVDADNNLLSGRTDQITLTFENDASGGSASITGGVSTASSGLAEFTSLSIDNVATGYTFRATSNDPLITSVVSGSFNTTPGVIDVSGTGTEISGTDLTRVADGAEAATILIQLKDVGGNNITSSGVDVTFATDLGVFNTTTISTNASGQASVTLTSTTTGTASVTATVDHDANGGTAQVAVTNASPLSVTFNPGAAAKLAFKTQPTNTRALSSIGPSVEVEILDVNNNRVTTATDNVTLSKNAGSPSGVLAGTLTRAAVAGVAEFDDLNLSIVGQNYSLDANSGALTSAISSTFDITGSPGGVNSNLRYWLDAQDLDGDGSAEGLPGESGQSSGQVSTWVDKASGLSFTNTEGTSSDPEVPGTTPDLKENQINFNNAIEFNELVDTDYLASDVTNFPTTAITQWLVLTSTSTFKGVFSFAHTSNFNEFLIFSPQNVRVDAAGQFNDNSGVDVNDGSPSILFVDRQSSNGNTHVVKNGGTYGSPFVLQSGANIEDTGILILAQEQDAFGGGFNDQDFVGQLAEVITYASILNATERQRVESYLGIKYGISLDQTSGKDYLASNGVVIWNDTEGTGYDSDIAGIGKDSGSTLEQTQSKSVNDDAILTIASDGAITDGSYLMWGNNDGNKANTSVVTINGMSHTMMDRIWKIQEKNFVDAGGSIGTASDLGAVDVTFDLTGLSPNVNHVRLLIDDDGTFGVGTTVSSSVGTVNGEVITFDAVTDISDGKYISVALDFTPKLVFTSQPSNTLIEQIINGSSGVKASVVDGADQVVTTSTINVLLSFNTDASGGTANLSGTLTKQASSGVASFEDISLDAVATDYSFKATSVGNASEGVSSNFSIVGAPGGIVDQLRYWLDANDIDADHISESTSENGLASGEVEVWSSKIGTESFVKSTTANFTPTAPDFLEASLNFNPSLEFNLDGSVDDLLGGAVTNFPTNKITQFIILQHNSTSAKAPFSYGVTNSTNEFTFFTANDRFELFHNGGELEESGFALPSDEVKLIAAHLDAGSELKIFENGKSGVDNMITPTALTGTGTIWLGQDQDSSTPGSRGSSSGNAFKGQIGEVITYAGVLIATDRLKVESYLALKYGITLDQTSATNYVNSAGTPVWNATTNSAYNDDIAGIGRDDNTGLNQKQSRSGNSDRLVTIGLDDDVTPDGLETSNLLNDGSFSANNSFLIWGNDNATLLAPDGSPAFTEIPAAVNSRLNRQWRVQESGTVGMVTIQFALSNIPGPSGLGTSNEGDLVLLVSDEPNFTSGTATVSVVNQSFEVGADELANFRYNFSDGDYFTLGSSQLAALPIKLVSFDATVKSDHILLEWITASEENHAFFRIDRAGPDLEFESVGTIELSNSILTDEGFRQYSLRDMKPKVGPNYYRLVDVDIGGVEHYSKLVRVNYSTNRAREGLSQMFSVKPNPARSGDMLNLTFKDVQGAYDIQIHNAHGTQIISKKGRFETENSKIDISVSGLSDGVYVARIISSMGWSESQKIIIKN